MKILLTTAQSSTINFIATPSYNTVEFITNSPKLVYVVTEELGVEEDIPASWPTWLEDMRDKASNYLLDNFVSISSKAYTKEYYGKEAPCEFTLLNKLNLLIEYLSVISLRMREDEYAAFERTPEYYYSIYFIDKIIDNFRCKGINIKPLLTIFKIDSYNSSNFNYDFNWAYNVEVDNGEIIVVNKTFRDYFTNYALTPTVQEEVTSLSGGQTSFTTTHNIKQLLSFTINGVDRVEKVDFVGKVITYNPSGGTFPYTIQSTDTVIVNYLYES